MWSSARIIAAISTSKRPPRLSFVCQRRLRQRFVSFALTRQLCPLTTATPTNRLLDGAQLGRTSDSNYLRVSWLRCCCAHFGFTSYLIDCNSPHLGDVESPLCWAREWASACLTAVTSFSPLISSSWYYFNFFVRP